MFFNSICQKNQTHSVSQNEKKWKFSHPNMMKFTILIFILGGIPTGCSNSSGDGASPSESLMNDLSSLSNSSNINQSSLSQKIYTEEAQLEDVKNHKSECSPSNDNSKKVCIKICHVPPGNPSKAKEMTLPISAMKAHLNHGSQHAEERDYLGSCRKEETSDDGDSASNDDTSSTDDTSSSGDNSSSTGDSTSDTSSSNTDSSTTDTSTDTSSSTGSTSGGTTGTDSTGTSGGNTSGDTSTSTGDTTSSIPLWCQPIVSIDSNCDGIDDATGEPIF